MASPGQRGTWTPVIELNRTDADVSIFFLNQNSIRYDAPVSGPLFQTETEASVYNPEMKYNVGYYYTNTLGCVDQHQYFNPSPSRSGGDDSQCTALTDYTSATQGLADLSLTDVQSNVSARISASLKYLNMHYAVYGRGASALRASELVRFGDEALYGGGTALISSPSLPDDQWQQEVSHWFALSMARLQEGVVGYATGPSDNGQEGSFVPPAPGLDQGLCHAQRVKNPGGYINFNIMDVIIVVGVSVACILLGATIDSIGGFFQGLATRHSYTRLAWALDNKMQLHRMAYEGAGWGTNRWHDTGASFPTFPGRLSLGRYEDHGYACIKRYPLDVHEAAPDIEVVTNDDTVELLNLQGP